ncbi:MAG: ACP S-malonyltransferase [Gammaproteobacteria bacterium]|nr:ACP S-malonyltransferase [Gammaproteobacteria bacterium]NIR96677.1 ACP S-malonyltransferase [Gammaproteobacteria bacterium]NIT62381.1 ACP S-malonyltransferase [Gammaproteobacteria bacterium]NIV19313.1 ACP S-malonyltransferase [Gammaproteobacteria bacterium]NIX10274.1 ACP S-malonyltransferase [Gammaproteobacteria bacterium]
MTLGFVFPGQGSQSVGMSGALAESYPVVRQTYEEASEALGYDLWQMAANGPEAELNLTHVTQPAMLAADVAVWRVWEQQGGARPAVMAGHSLGEYAALVCAGALPFAGAAAAVAERGRLMQQSVPAGAGAMAAILGLDDETVGRVCREAAEGGMVEAVNFNAPGQVVIAGERAAVERATALAKGAGAKRAVALPVSVPSHCALMRPAAEQLAERLANLELRAPALPVLHNCDLSAHADPGQIREALVRQLYSPVRWVETIQAFAARGVETVVECGPGKVLAGLNRRIDRNMKIHAVYDPAGLDQALLQLGSPSNHES